MLRPGYRADVNVIDFDAPRLDVPDIVHDLSAGWRRMVQRATGHRQTFVAGTEIMAEGGPSTAIAPSPSEHP